jgi:transcription termination/antitermination protein NusG
MGGACLDNDVHTAAFLSDLSSARATRLSLPWYTVKVRTGGEQSAIAALTNRGFAPYCPVQKERRPYSDRMKVVEAAVFPGYVFCQFDCLKKLLIISSPGVEYIVGFAGVPVAVPEEELINISRMIEEGAHASPSLVPGQQVRVTRGPLKGVEGILVRDTRGHRLVVSIELLQQGTSLYIDEAEVTPIGGLN